LKVGIGDRIFNSVNVLILGLISLIMLFPFYYVLIVSFTTEEQYMRGDLILFPEKWTLSSYQYLLSTNTFTNAIGVSTFLAVVGTILSLIITSAFSYSLSRRRLMGRKIIMMALVITLLFSPGMIPHYLLVRDLGLINSIWALILPVLTSGWYVLLMKSFFDSIPASLEESATIDGANDITVWFRIILPLSLPSLAAFGLFYAVSYWNTFFTAVLYINDFEKWPLQLLLQNMLIDSNTSLGVSMEVASENQMPAETLKMAAVIIATVPILLVYPFLQKHFAKGVMLGSVKE